MADAEFSFDSWKEGGVAPVKLKVPVRLAELKVAQPRQEK
jgi:hypothetical protein